MSPLLSTVHRARRAPAVIQGFLASVFHEEFQRKIFHRKGVVNGSLEMSGKEGTTSHDDVVWRKWD